MYSPPLFDLSALIFFPRVFSTKDLKILKVSNTSYFYLIKQIQQYLEQSSMKVRKYIDPFMDVVGIGPKTSLCIKSSVEETLLSFPTSYICYGCFPTKKSLQTPREDLMRGNPSTISLLCSYWSYLKFRWQNISCQILLLSLAWVNRKL